MLSTLAGFYYKAHVCRTYGARFFAVSLTQPLRASNGRPQRPRRKIDAWGTHLKQKAGPFRAGRNLRSRCPAGRLGMTGVVSHDGLALGGVTEGLTSKAFAVPSVICLRNRAESMHCAPPQSLRAICVCDSDQIGGRDAKHVLQCSNRQQRDVSWRVIRVAFRPLGMTPWRSAIPRFFSLTIRHTGRNSANARGIPKPSAGHSGLEIPRRVSRRLSIR